ncbi:hypothetical protein FRC09_017965 [Ceratobasidium sp. 395]|nr:hypothetical protein FRC09_017965 [Ceratobasidium sp. 395]
MPVTRESFDTLSRARADRRQSIESAMSDASSMRSMSSPKPKPVGPVVQVDRTRPPTMMLPPPPPMPPPPMPAPSLIRRTTGNAAPPRPTSPPPPELIHRATTPTFGGPSSLLVPQRTYGSSRHTGPSMPPSPAGGLRQPPSTSSFRSTPNAMPAVAGRPAQGASMASGSSRRPSISSSRGSSEQHRTRFAPATEAQRQTGTTDPAVIQAITQTMIGEFLFKYTRKVVGKGHGEKRHKRFFWVHPYTKTLYWSDADPGANGVLESSAKSAYIDSVKAVLDPNPVPPGIHQYSIVVSTPQREMKFTAPTKERHDIWLNALTYLLARPSTVPLASEANSRPSYNPMPSGPADEIRQQIMSSPRSVRTAGSTSYHDNWNSNTTPKAFRTQSQMSSGGSVGKRHGTPAAEYMRWNAPEAQSPTKSTRGYQQQMMQDDGDYEDGDHSQYDDGFVPIEVDPGFEGLENVRACCDGAHDLGSLSRHPGHRHHHHHHNRPPSRAQDADRPISPRPLSPAFSFSSRASSKSHGGGGSMFSWRGDGGERKYGLKFGSKRSKSKRPTSPDPR